MKNSYTHGRTQAVRVVPLSRGLWVGSEKETHTVCLFIQLDDFSYHLHVLLLPKKK